MASSAHEIIIMNLDNELCWQGCACGILDATNTTVERREAVAARCAEIYRRDVSPRYIAVVWSSVSVPCNFQCNFHVTSYVTWCRCAAHVPPVQLLFVESVCNDEEQLLANYQLKLSNADYEGRDQQARCC